MEESKCMKVEVISRETIKPSSPSPKPDQPGTFKLSLLDQFSALFYIPTLLFYKASGSVEVHEKSHRLKSSLSETLTRFYPFAGRLKDPLTITCNDEGVDYSEVRVLNCSLFDVLEKPNLKQLDSLIPNEADEPPDLASRPLLLIQVSFFECGGMALGLRFNHRVADAATFCSFINGWADSARGNVINPATPDFTASTLYPPTDKLPPSPQIPQQKNNKPSVRTCRFVFGPSELASLQAKATSTNNPRPSRVVAVTAFICKIALLSKKESRPSSIAWGVNLRPKLQPRVPDNCFGNLVGHPVHEVGVDGNNMSSLADYLRRGTIDICDEFIQVLKECESEVGTLENDMHKRNLLGPPKDDGTREFYHVTSWCKLPFYDADFGWGKPLWMTNGGSHPMPQLIVLTDTRDGNGIEVKMSLTEEEMTRFECDQELKNYAAFNPSAFS